MGGIHVKIRLHFNRVNMQRHDPRVWSAHTHKSCNGATEVSIQYAGKVIGRTVYKPEAQQPRAYVEFAGRVETDAQGHTIIVIEEEL